MVVLLLLTVPGTTWSGERILPTFAEVKAAHVPSEAWLLDRHGEILAEKRVDLKVRRLPWVALNEISPVLPALVIAAEDRNFYRHAGVDWPALAASAWLYLSHEDGKHPRGASTLTMQLAGFLDPALQPKGASRTLTQKWAQARQARALEKSWSKPEILEAYLNLAPFRGEIVGIQAAARVLFGKAPSALTRPESLLLAALLKGPLAKPQVVAKRACAILSAWGEEGTALCQELPGLAATALAMSYALPAANLAPHLAQQLLQQPGTQVTTTLDAGLQRFARQALQEHLSDLAGREVEDGAVIVLDNASGEVLAYVGSNLATSESGDVDGVQALRQAGSTLKPFLYGLAIAGKQLTAASVLDDSPVQLATPSGLYIPQNYDRDFKGPVTVRTALASSLNVPAVRTLNLLGVERFVQGLRGFGLDSVSKDGRFYGFGLALGGAEVRLADLANAYRALANGGLWSPLRLVPEGPTAPSRQVLTEPAAFIIAEILADRSARATTFGFDNPLATRTWAAVKTGTSKDMRDNWCLGFSRRYTVGVWVGNFSGEPMRDVSGVSGAAPVWRDIMEYLDHDVQTLTPRVPRGVIAQPVHFLPEIEPSRSEWFIKGTEVAEIRLAAYEEDNKGLFAKIIYPAAGTIIAIDPDIPEGHQRVRFAARSGAAVTWVLAGSTIGTGESIWWRPAAGVYQLCLTDLQGKELDKVTFTVRGDPAGF
ncbi:MAG: penicillin-binding protein 1C [Desulfobulbaceae bacterium]|nr:penicillin-binding protein 1C [Desulfobulbaceae bacterium]